MTIIFAFSPIIISRIDSRTSCSIVIANERKIAIGMSTQHAIISTMTYLVSIAAIPSISGITSARSTENRLDSTISSIHRRRNDPFFVLRIKCVHWTSGISICMKHWKRAVRTIWTLPWLNTKNI